MIHPSRLVLAAAGLLTTLPAVAADADLKALRAEIAQMKQAYEQRIEALEKRLGEAESTSSQAKAAADKAATQAARAGEGKASAFNPEIGLVLQGQARRMQDVPERTVSGYWPAGHDHGGDKRGFSLQHSELILSANIDPSFRGVARFAITGDNEVEVEEASVSTLGLGGGFTARAGRFASDIGYQNARHPHEWDFADATLMQKVLFGAEGYRHDGLQLKWTAPTELFLQLGAEIGRGDVFPGTDRNKNGSGAGAIFVKTGGDFGASNSWQAGLSLLNTKAADREAHFEDVAANEVQGYFSGKSRTAIADFVWKWAPNGNASIRSLKLQGEVFRRTESGTFGCTSDIGNGPAPCDGGVALGDLSTRQTGGYASAVYQFMPKWRVGYRHDWLGKGTKSFDATVFNTLDAGNHYFADFKPRKDSVMIDWSNSEFSRLRLQYARDRAMQGVTDNQWTLQYIMSLGAHGAHKF
ncbi:MAG: TonB-dependent receptor [Pseudomonadota bacterium]